MKKYRNRVGTLAAVLLSLSLVTTSMVSGLMARHVSQSSGGDTARVAVMASNVEIPLGNVVMIHPGETNIVPIKLTNKDGNVICEVDQRYIMTVEPISESINNLPLEYSLYKDEGCKDEAEITVDGSTLSGAEGTFEASVEQTASYWLKVTWPKDQNNAYLAFEIDALKVKVRAEQID